MARPKKTVRSRDHVEVAYRGRPLRRTGQHPSVARWDVLELLARVVDHIPEPSQQMVRYWGFYANAARGKRRKAAPGRDIAQAAQGQDDWTRQPRPVDYD